LASEELLQAVSMMIDSPKVTIQRGQLAAADRALDDVRCR